MNCNVKILDKRFYLPSLKDVAGLESVQLRFQRSDYFEVNVMNNTVSKFVPDFDFQGQEIQFLSCVYKALKNKKWEIHFFSPGSHIVSMGPLW